jgi:hypothetical protein
MRSISTTLGGCLLLMVAGPLSAQTVPYQARVTQPTAEVRCLYGTGPDLYTTNQLRQGDVVQVVQDLGNGWLAILPPQGSFSWINSRDVTHPPEFVNNPDRFVVNQGTTAYVFKGSELHSGSRGTVHGAQLTSGSQVDRVHRPTVHDDDGDWIPIEPPHTEVRYVLAESVKPAPGNIVQNPGQAYPAVNAGQTSPSPLPPLVPGTLAPRPPLTAAQLTWQQAQQAERVGNISEAIQLYSQMATQTSGPDHDLAMQGLNRAYWLREAQRNTVVQTIPPLQTRAVPATTASQVRYGSGVAPDTTGSGVQPAPAAPGTQPFASAIQQAPVTTPTSSSASPWQPVTPDGYPSSGPGRLRRAGRFLENRRTYVLESSQNYPMLYVTPNTGIDLEPFVDKNVELFGPAIYRGDLRANYMTVVRVQPLP